MFAFFTRPFTEDDAQFVSGWQYAAPYDVYGKLQEISIASYRALCDAENTLCGFFCWGEEARVTVATALYTKQPEALDIGLSLRPDLTGKGLGLCAMDAVLGWLRKIYKPSIFRLAVYAWNMRALHVYKRMGFEVITVCGAFLIMQLDDRPFLDASTPLEIGMRLYPDDPPFDRHLVWKKEDCGFDVSLLSMSAHTGTHIDAPSHVGYEGGAEGIDLSVLQGSVQLLDFMCQSFEDIHTSRILLKNTVDGLTQAEAQMLVDANVVFVGIDRLSVGNHAEEWLVHKTLLESGMVVLENANLQCFSAGWYQMRCLPLLIPGSDGVPARLLLREEQR